MSAGRAVDPAYMLKNYLYSSSNGKIIADLAAIKTTLLQGPLNGNLLSSVSNYGRTTYHYNPPEEYTGNEQAIFLAEFKGKVYRVIINIVVSPHVGESPLMEGEEPVCPPPKLIKVTKPSSGASGYGSGYDLSSISVIFADLPGAAVGQTSTPARRNG